MSKNTRVVIIGAGFGGLYAARTLSKSSDVEVILIDRNNFHTFTPLLYQVATCALDPSAIAYPVRSIFRSSHNVHFMMGEVDEINTAERYVHVNTTQQPRRVPYDYLIVAAGSKTNYFNQESLQRHAFGLKDLDDALRLRHHILRLFERASWTDDEDEKNALTTLVVVGGGPTGLETAGALYELYNYVLKQEYDDRHDLRAKVILLEATGRLLVPYPERLQQAALDQLSDLGVEVMLNAMVSDASPEHIELADGRRIHTHTLVWAAGVKASPLAAMLGVSLARGGRIPVLPTMQVQVCDRVYAVGDITYLEDKKGEPYPMLIPVAKQQGILAARNILRALHHDEEPATFRYHDRGIMATIGRSRAVAWIFYRIQLTGFLAWLSWLFLHLIVLLGFRNRVSVFINWVWNYVTYDRSVRIIVDKSTREEPVHTSVHAVEDVKRV